MSFASALKAGYAGLTSGSQGSKAAKGSGNNLMQQWLKDNNANKQANNAAAAAVAGLQQSGARQVNDYTVDGMFGNSAGPSVPQRGTTGSSTSSGNGSGGPSAGGTVGTSTSEAATGGGDYGTGGDQNGAAPGDGGGGDLESGKTFAFPGGTPYSATGLKTLLENPYAFAQAWLESMGPAWNTPSMLAALGQMPALAPSLEILLYGDQGTALDGIDAADSAQRYLDIMRDQLRVGGGVSAEDLINKILTVAKAERTSPGTGAADEIQTRLGAIVGGITDKGGSSADQINTINDLIKVAMINAAPARAGVIANMLDYYANSYLTDVARVTDTNPVVSYAEWLADKGLMF